MLTTVLLARSTWPEEIEWWLIWSLACITRSVQTSCMTSAVKWVPQAELTLKVSPNLETIWFINRQAVVSAVSLRAGRHSIHFVNSQTTLRKYLLPCVDRDRGPTQSIWRYDHGKVIPFLSSGALGFGFAGWTWQTHQASLHVFRYVLLDARPVCYLLVCFIGGLGAVVSCGSGTYVRTLLDAACAW